MPVYELEHKCWKCGMERVWHLWDVSLREVCDCKKFYGSALEYLEDKYAETINYCKE